MLKNPKPKKPSLEIKQVSSEGPISSRKVLIKKCHLCGHISESLEELSKCSQCHKSFLPLNYFNKIHGTNNQAYKELFSHTDELSEEDLIKGIYVIW